MHASRRLSRGRLALATFVLGALLAVPGGYVLGLHQFTDVPDSNTYHADIDALADAGVTTGCGDGTTYCPKDFVTREQMAAFMNRLGALGPGKTPVVNADRLDGRDSGGFLQSQEIAIRQFSTWESVGALVIAHNGTNEQLLRPSAGSGSAQLGLVGPAIVGGVWYGLTSVEVCYMASANTLITSWSVMEVSPTGSAIPLLTDADGFTPSVAGCVSMAGAGPDDIGNVYHITINQSTSAGASGLRVTQVKTVWEAL